MLFARETKHVVRPSSTWLDWTFPEFPSGSGGTAREFLAQFGGGKRISGLIHSSHTSLCVCWLSSDGTRRGQGRKPFHLPSGHVQLLHCWAGCLTKVSSFCRNTCLPWQQEGCWVSTNPCGLQPTSGVPASSGAPPPPNVHLPALQTLPHGAQAPTAARRQQSHRGPLTSSHGGRFSEGTLINQV